MITTEFGAEPDIATPRRRRRWVIVTAALSTVVLLSAVAWIVFFSSLIGVRSVAVRGQHVLTSAEIVQVARVPHGTPLVRLDTGAVQRRVEGLPEVASVDVETSFPSTVVITVVERTAVGYLRSGSSDLLVDRTGAQFRTVSAAPPDLPEFVIPAGASGRAAGQSVATVASALPATLRSKLSSIQALDPAEVTLVLRNDKIVRWGSPQRSADKARVLLALLHRDNRQIDVSNPDLPFTR